MLRDALKCPCCGEVADHLAYKNIEARGKEGRMRAVVLACPSCDLLLGASISPAEYTQPAETQSAKPAKA